MNAPCIACRGRGWSWGRAKPYQKGRMVKRECPHCKGSGHQPLENKSSQGA